MFTTLMPSAIAMRAASRSSVTKKPFSKTYSNEYKLVMMLSSCFTATA